MGKSFDIPEAAGAAAQVVKPVMRVKRTVDTTKTVNDMADAMDSKMRREDGSVDYSDEAIKEGLKAANGVFNDKMNQKVQKVADFVDPKGKVSDTQTDKNSEYSESVEKTKKAELLSSQKASVRAGEVLHEISDNEDTLDMIRAKYGKAAAADYEKKSEADLYDGIGGDTMHVREASSVINSGKYTNPAIAACLNNYEKANESYEYNQKGYEEVESSLSRGFGR